MVVVEVVCVCACWGCGMRAPWEQLPLQIWRDTPRGALGTSPAVCGVRKESWCGKKGEEPFWGPPLPAPCSADLPRPWPPRRSLRTGLGGEADRKTRGPTLRLRVTLPIMALINYLN